MNTIIDVYCVSVPVSDQDQAVAFFADKLGFEIRQDALAGESRWVTVATPGGKVEVALQADTARAGNDTGIRFVVTDAEGEHNRLGQIGVEVKDVLRWPGVPPMFQFDDPDGNTYTMIETP